MTDESLDPRERARKLAAWLMSLSKSRVRDAKPIKVTFKYKTRTEVYYGARYTQVAKYTSGMMAVQRGDKAEGEEYTQEFFYMPGALPYSTRRKVRVGPHWEDRVVYRVPKDDGDWYVCGYFQEAGTQHESAKFHPFGNYFQLSRWDREKAGPIDKYDNEAGKRERLDIAVEAL